MNRQPQPPWRYAISRSTRHDLPRIREIVGTVLAEYQLVLDPEGTDADIHDPDTFEEYFRRGGLFVVIRDNDGTIVGTAGLYPRGKQLVELRKMYLLPEVRGQGLGRWLLDYLIDEARAREFWKIGLETNTCLTTATRLYEKNGFKVSKCGHRSGRCDRYYTRDIGPRVGRGLGIPRRFSLGSLLGFAAAYTCFCAMLRTLGATGWYFVFWVGLVLFIAVSQAVLFGGRYPRGASMVAGGVYGLLWTLGSVFVHGVNRGAEVEIAFWAAIGGVLFGYVLGTLSAVLFAVGQRFKPIEDPQPEEQTP